MAWFRVEVGRHKHRKIERLRRLLETLVGRAMTRLEAVGFHDVLLSIVTEAGRVDGSLAGITPEDLAAESDFAGTPAALLDAFVAAGLIDRLEDGDLVVHDYEERSAASRDPDRARALAAERQRRYREAHKRNAVTPALRDVTSPSRSTDEPTNEQTTRTNGETDLAPPKASPLVDAPLVCVDVRSPRIGDGDVDRVLAHYKAQGHERARPGDKERKLIRARLKEGYTVADLCRAIDGCHRSPHHCGKNDRGTIYQTLELIVRDSKHVQMFLEHAERGAGTEEPTRIIDGRQARNHTAIHAAMDRRKGGAS